MEVLTNILLGLSVLGVFVFGYFLMTRLDKFLEENRKTIEKENEKQEPSRIMLTEELTDEEITEEIHRFRSKHKGTRIVLYDSYDTKTSDSPTQYTKQKR